MLTPAEVEWVADAGREGAEAARMRTERRALEERLARSADPDEGRALAQFLRNGPRELDSAVSEIFLGFQAAKSR